MTGIEREAKAPRSYGEALAMGAAFLQRKGTQQPRREAEIILAHALGVDRTGLYMGLEKPIEAGELERARAWFARRAKGEPVAYLIGRREFYGREFLVDRRVLIPRPESELLIDQAREFVAAARHRNALEGPASCADFGTGSGNLAVSLALELPAVSVVASDVDRAALEVARANATRLGAQVEFVHGDGPLALLCARPARGFDVLVSNPPYIDPAVANTLESDVREHEPALALFAPAGDPDRWVRELIAAASALLAPSGRAWIELGHDQSDRALELARRAALVARVIRDAERIPRVLELALPVDELERERS